MSALIPRYYFSNEYIRFYDYFLSQPHIKRSFRAGEYLWPAGTLLEKVYYLRTGIMQTSLEHEDGHRKITSFHGPGTVFPGCHQQNFKIENSIISVALTEVETLEFTKNDYYRLLRQNSELALQTLEWHASYINLLLYEAAHQEYNSLFIRLCNLLYLFSQNAPAGKKNQVGLTQEELADILAVNRVNVAKNLARLRSEQIIVSHRKWIEIIDLEKLMDCCSLETLP